MNSFKNIFFTFVFCIAITLCFNSCKKYPKNSLWFQDPAVVLARGKR